jgi:uncharacterized phage protein (TIGR02218 family)
MKRLMPSSLITFLQTNKNCLKADLFIITLPTGTIMYLCEGPQNITVPYRTNGWSGATQTFLSSTYGRWERGAITSEAGFNCNSNTMTLTCIAQQLTPYPGMSIGLLNAAMRSLFDATTVTVLTAYMPLNNYGNVSAGVETKFVGTITKITNINRTKVEFECSDPMYLLDMKIPTRLFQASCPWSFADNNCNLSAPDYTIAFTAASGSTQYLLIPTSSFTQPAGYFTQGVVKCTSGANNGLSQTVKLHAAGNLNISAPWIMPITVGDTFSVIYGCNKTMSACSGTTTAAGVATNNLINFGGTPYVPPASSAV